MKKLLFILLCLPLVFACNDGNDPVPVSKERTITYKFNTNAAPTGANNLIGVQIYKGVKTGSLVQYSPYAYGLFDDFSKIKLELPKDAEYKIVSSVVVDGKTKVGKDGNGYLKPFALGGTAGVQLTNTFTLDDTRAMTLLNQSTTTIAASNKKSTKESDSSQLEPLDYKIPNLDRYYGEVTEYDGNSNDNPVVDMQRQVFGIRFTVEFEGDKIEPNDCMFLAVKGAPDTLFVYAKDAVKTIEAMYTMSDFTAETPLSIQIDVYHKMTDGTLRRMDGTSGTSLYRNTLMILNQKIIRDESTDSYPYKWDGIDVYYTNRGSI